MDLQTGGELKQRERYYSCWNTNLDKELHNKPQFIKRNVFSFNPEVPVESIFVQ